MYKEKLNNILNNIEKIGNSLPHPIYMFIILSILVMLISSLLSGKIVNTDANGNTIVINNLLSKNGLIWILDNVVKNFITFPPLGMVLVTMLGIGLAEETNFLKTLLKVCIIKAPKRLVTYIVIFAGIMGNIAGSAVFIIIPPLGAIIFKSLKRHPIAGLASGFIGVSGGLSANLLITPTDVINSGITDLSAKIADPTISVHPSSNWYFMIASTFLLTIVGALVIEKIIEPRLGKFEDNKSDDSISVVSNEEKKALRYAVISIFLYVFIVLLTIVPKNGILRGENNSIVPSPFLNSMIPILTLLFFIPSLVYAVKTKQIKNKNDIINMLSKSLSGLSSFVLLCFFASQFVNFFSYTNLGILISIKGANYIKEMNISGIHVILLFMLFTAFVNLFIGSLSAKWTILAPIFVPMFMEIGISPFFTQAAFRIPDSVVNSISPLEPFMPFIIICMQKYNKNYGLGTVILIMLPLAISYFISWTLLLIIWYYFNIPLGPEAGIFI